MDDLLMLCATGPAGEALWDRATALFSPEHESRLADRLFIRNAERELFEGLGGLPTRDQIREYLQKRVSARSFEALQIAIVVSPRESEGLLRLQALLDAVQGIS